MVMIGFELTGMARRTGQAEFYWAVLTSSLAYPYYFRVRRELYSMLRPSRVILEIILLLIQKNGGDRIWMLKMIRGG